MQRDFSKYGRMQHKLLKGSLCNKLLLIQHSRAESRQWREVGQNPQSLDDGDAAGDADEVL